MRDPERKVPVIGHEDEPLRVEIQTTDWIRHRRNRDQLANRWTLLGIGHGRNNTGWLVHEPRDEVRVEWQHNAIDSNDIGGGIDALANRCGFVIDGDSPTVDQNVGLAARSEAGSRNQLVESFDDDSGLMGSSRVSTICAGGT